MGEPIAPLPEVDTPIEEDAVTFLRTQANGSPIRWDRCRPIRYVINPDGAPSGANQYVIAALTYASHTSGFKFEYAGTTKEEAGQYQPRAYLPTLYGKQWSPVLITWRPSLHSKATGDRAVGMAFPESVRRPRGGVAYVTGWISLSIEAYNDWQNRFGRDRTAQILQSTVLHEAGHVLGLGHNPNKGEIMFSTVHSAINTYQSDDLAGLAALSSDECMSDL